MSSLSPDKGLGSLSRSLNSLLLSPSSSNCKLVSDSLPDDLIFEILSRLPAKSIARFHCVSKLWASMLGRPCFKKLFLTRSSVQPRLIFAIENENDRLWSIFSLPQQHQSSAEFHLQFPPEEMRMWIKPDDGFAGGHRFSCAYASGLIYFYGMWVVDEEKNENAYIPMVCNPKTGRYVTLPCLYRFLQSYSFFGFDPIDRQFKVLFKAKPSRSDHHIILTLGTGEMRWRKIECSIRHAIVGKGICINGVLYYLGDSSGYFSEECYYDSDLLIVCFDVRFEKFNFIHPLESLCQLINYKGRLGVVYHNNCVDDAIELRVWVLEDLEKQEWSKYAYTLRDDKFSSGNVSVVGVIATGEIVLSMTRYTSKQPFYVFYYNPERNTLQRVEIGGFGEYHNAFSSGSRFGESHNAFGYRSRVHVFLDDCSNVYAFADHVEYLNVNDPKLLKSSVYAPYKEEGREYLFSSSSEEED